MRMAVCALLLMLQQLLLLKHGASAAARVDADAPGALRYDGHGALSAGASSRLLYDYAEPQRGDILDYLYAPNFGASLDLIKVEIGGDSQSTDGTEASHMHTRGDLDCHRGYEWWLLEEARARNPGVVTYALSWAVPEWVGNDTYYSEDNIEYHMNWLRCARNEHPGIGTIDYIGAWNERSWGNPDWIVKFRRAMDREGFNDTKIIIPDGGWDQQILVDLNADKDKGGDFSAALAGGGIGLHYPCNAPHPEVQLQYGLKYWSSEDYSTVADWSGAGCWGRLLNQNVVRMNMTSTIAWSLIWSVYDDWPYFGNGLMYANRPWSGHYEVNQAIWTAAHHTQFMDPGWEYVGGGRGFLPKGGSWVSVMSPLKSNLTAPSQPTRDITIVMEKLHGDCLRCPGQTTEAEPFTLSLSASLRYPNLQLWMTNETDSFLRLPDVPVDLETGEVTVMLRPDTIYTLTSLATAKKGNAKAPIPKPAPFPLPYTENFENRSPSSFPKYFSDNGGSFEIAAEAKGAYLLQAVRRPPIRNRWVPDVEPITILGDNTTAWGDKIRVDVKRALFGADFPVFNFNKPHK
eukprot:g1804.t1